MSESDKVWTQIYKNIFCSLNCHRLHSTCSVGFLFPYLPREWLHAYDPGMVITRERLYDIKAIPTIYLLDSDKKVLLKDSSIQAVESFFSLNG